MLSDWITLRDSYGGICVSCGQARRLTIDHIQPLSAGGDNTIRNVQPLCMPCNSAKGGKTVDYRDRVTKAGRAPSFRGAAAEAQAITAREWLLSGPAETGKTWAGLFRLDSEARRWPNSQWIIVRKVRATMDSTVLNTWRRIIALRGGVTVFGGEKPGFYTYPNGARVWVVGMDNPDKILSGEFDGAYYNQAEELDEADHETVTTRVTGRGAVTDTPMVWGDCNPGAEDHWIQRRAASGALRLLESRHEDNPTLYDAAGAITAQGQRSMAALDALTGVRYQRLRLGRWVGAEGAFFATLDPHHHLVDYARAPEGWPTWAALDYGWFHPLSFGVFTSDPQSRIIMLGRHSASRMYSHQHAEKIGDLLDALGVPRAGLRIVAGHDCWAEGHDDPETVAEKFGKLGYRLERATTARVQGARAVGERLGDPAQGIAPTLLLNARYGGKAVLDALARLVPDPHNQEDVRKINADAAGRGGDDDYDMLRYGVMAGPPPHRGADLVGFV
jgi:hypothetical protein